jgi:hypothetical protein
MVGFGIAYPKPNHDPNVPMLIWNMVRFRTPSVPNPTCSKFDLGHDPNVPMLIWNMVRFRTPSVPNLTCSKFDLGYPKLDSEHNHVSDMDIPNRKVRFGKSEIEMSIWECPKSNSEQKWIWATTEILEY